MGRPSDYSPEICAEICARLIEGESLKAWFRDRREELTIEQRQWFETALYAIERGVASIKLRGHAKAGELRAVE
jgi:hypothetical protein